MRIINVVEILNGTIAQIIPFPILEDQLSEDVFKDARNTFYDIIKEHRDDFTEDDIEELFKAGKYDDDNGYSLEVIWSHS